MHTERRKSTEMELDLLWKREAVPLTTIHGMVPKFHKRGSKDFEKALVGAIFFVRGG